ncbi:four helix bundle protein, partial [bacterium]|nr:four helix bundle protein [bacterium]
MNNDFNFRQTKVYILAKEFRKKILETIKINKLDRILSDQINRASLSIVLNIAEGFGRFHKTDKRNFYVI